MPPFYFLYVQSNIIFIPAIN